MSWNTSIHALACWIFSSAAGPVSGLLRWNLPASVVTHSLHCCGVANSSSSGITDTVDAMLGAGLAARDTGGSEPAGVPGSGPAGDCEPDSATAADCGAACCTACDGESVAVLDGAGAGLDADGVSAPPRRGNRSGRLTSPPLAAAHSLSASRTARMDSASWSPPAPRCALAA